MKATGWKIKHMVMENICIWMEQLTKDNGSMTSKMGEESKGGQMEQSTMDII
jgi:hypothetical protein